MRGQRLQIVVMGVSGCGKSSFGAALAYGLVLDFVDGDDLHSVANVAKMRSGSPLDDADRAPWLDAIGTVLADAAHHPDGVVIACSALKRAYRDRIRAAAGPMRFLFLDADRALIERRFAGRQHFMPASLIDSQFATLERPGAGEPDVITLDAARPLGDLVARTLPTLRPSTH